MKSWEGADIIKLEGMTLHGICKSRPLYTSLGRRSISQAIFFGFSSLKLMRESFDAMDCCGFPYFSLFACRIVTWIKKKPLYSTVHEVWGREYWKEYLGRLAVFGYWIEKISLTLPDTIIAVSNHTEKKLRIILNSKKKIITIPNGLDVSKLKNILPSDSKSDIIYVGRLLAHKNIDVLMQAVEIVKKSSPDILLAIVGDGPEKDNLEKLAISLGLENNVRFYGFVENNEEVYSLMHASRVFVLPSSREGFGMVVVEANACGLPVITVDHADNAAKDLILNSENGKVCSLGKLELADAVEKNLVNRKDGEFYKNFAKKYNWENIIRIIKQVYV
jgi:glycosyltransferase involved in cell wall biosynthesis